MKKFSLTANEVTYLEQWIDADHNSSFNLAMERELYLLAADEIIGGGAIDADTDSKTARSILKKYESLPNLQGALECERNALLTCVDIWVDPKTNEHQFYDTSINSPVTDDDLTASGFTLASRYDHNGQCATHRRIIDYIVQQVKSPNDTNGNPRVAWVVYSVMSGNILDVIDNGYAGIPKFPAGQTILIADVNVSASEYRSFLALATEKFFSNP